MSTEYTSFITAKDGQTATIKGPAELLDTITLALVAAGARFRTVEQTWDFGFYDDSPIAPLTFEQWQATRVTLNARDFAEAQSVDVADVGPEGGYEYDGGCYIERMEDGSFSVLIGNTQQIADNLTDAEVYLFNNWYLPEHSDSTEAAGA